MSGKTRLSNQWRHLMFVKWKYTAHEKICVKVVRFLKIVWKISNLNQSRRLIYKIRNFLTSGFEIYAIWFECLVNKLSQIPDHNTSYYNPNKVREMMTHLGTHLFIKDNANVCTMLLNCVRNHNRLCLKVFELSQIDDKS